MKSSNGSVQGPCITHYGISFTNLPAPGIIAQEIMDDLEAALEQFAAIAEDLK